MVLFQNHRIYVISLIILCFFAPPLVSVEGLDAHLQRQLMSLASDPNDELANRVFRQLFEKLESAKSRRDEEAAHIILWLADTNCGLDAVLEASRSRHCGVRQLAVGLLTRFGSPRALSRLIEVFEEPAKGLEDEIILAGAREENIQKPIEQLKESYVQAIREEILRVFAEVPDGRITKLLIEHFEASSGKEKLRVGYMLSKRMGSDAMPLVLPLLGDKEYDNSVVLSILSHIGGEEVEQILLNALDSGSYLYTLVQCLQRMGTDKSVPALVRALERPMHKNIRILIIRTLGRIGSDEAVDVIAADLMSQRYRYRAVNALGRTGNPRAGKIILNLLAQEDIEDDWGRWVPRRKYGLTAACVHAIGSLGSNETIPVLKTFLGSESHEVRLEALAALTKLDGPKWLEEIYPFLDLESDEFANLDAKVYLDKTDKPEERKRPLRERAIEMLVESQDQKAISTVLQHFHERYNNVNGASALKKALFSAGPEIIPALLEFIQGRDLKDGNPFTWTVIHKLAQYKDQRALTILERAYDAYNPKATHHFDRIGIHDVRKVLAEALTEFTEEEYTYFCMIPFE